MFVSIGKPNTKFVHFLYLDGDEKPTAAAGTGRIDEVGV